MTIFVSTHFTNKFTDKTAKWEDMTESIEKDKKIFSRWETSERFYTILYFFFFFYLFLLLSLFTFFNSLQISASRKLYSGNRFRIFLQIAIWKSIDSEMVGMAAKKTERPKEREKEKSSFRIVDWWRCRIFTANLRSQFLIWHDIFLPFLIQNSICSSSNGIEW